MTPLHIVWQRLVDSRGQTCNRCGDTYEALQSAVTKLKAALAPLGLEPVLETKVINEELFKGEPSESNRIWIEGRPMEEWLDATVGASRCCSVCGESECRTIEVEGAVFEAVPEELILKAALIAATRALAPKVERPPRHGRLDSAKPKCCADSASAGCDL
jgi:hypothetical protein